MKKPVFNLEKHNPGVAFGAGVNFYVWKYLIFFVQARYVKLTQYSDVPILLLNSISVSYGLGINFYTKKKK